MSIIPQLVTAATGLEPRQQFFPASSRPPTGCIRDMSTLTSNGVPRMHIVMSLVFDVRVRGPAAADERLLLAEPDRLGEITAALVRWIALVGFAVACVPVVLLLVVLVLGG
jgi:hypothetical protein